MTIVGGGIVPPPPPPPVRITTISTPTTLSSGSIPSTVSTTVLFTQNKSSDPFSYGMPSFDSKSVLTYSTLHTMGLGAGNSNSPLQGSVPSATSSFNAITYGGGHIPPPYPSISGMFQQSIRPNARYIFLVEVVWDLHPT
jgi:hypothetical protein